MHEEDYLPVIKLTENNNNLHKWDGENMMHHHRSPAAVSPDNTRTLLSKMAFSFFRKKIVNGVGFFVPRVHDILPLFWCGGSCCIQLGFQWGMEVADHAAAPVSSYH